MVKESLTKKKSKLSDGAAFVKNLKPKKMGSEIDEIFARKKRKNPEKALTASAKSKDEMKTGQNIRPIDLKENPFSGPISKPRKKTVGGLAIYTEEELGIGKAEAGGTSLCPFDCDCCF